MNEPLAAIDEVRGRVATLESHWKRTDAKLDQLDHHIGQLASRHASTDAKLDSVIEAMRDINRRDNQPVNWVGISGFVLAVVIGGSNYVDLRLKPVADETTKNRAAITSINEVIDGRGLVIGDFGARLTNIETSDQHSDELRHDLEARVGHLEQQAAAAEVSRKAIGDYVRQIDELGSRHWVPGPPQKASRVDE